MNKYTSLKLSKLLAENGFEGESEYWRINNNEEIVKGKPHKAFLERNNCYKTFDILNDLCVKYAKELFGEERQLYKTFANRAQEVDLEDSLGIPVKILVLLQQNKKDEAEEYLWDNCLFNKKNK